MKPKQNFSEFIREEIIKYFILVIVTIFLTITILIYFIVNRQTENNLKNETEEINQYITDDFEVIERETKNIIKKYNIEKNRGKIKKDFYKLRTRTNVKFNFTILNDKEVLTSNLYKHNLKKFQSNKVLKEGIDYVNKYNKNTYVKPNNIDYSPDQDSAILFMVEIDKYYIVFEFLEESLKNLNKDNSTPLVIIDDFDNVLYQDTLNFKDSIGKISIDTNKNTFIADTASLFGQKIYNVKIKNIEFNQQMIFLSYILIFFISLLFLAIIPILSNKIVASVTAPLHNFIKVIETNKKGKLNHLTDINSFYEFDLLGKRYNELLRSIQTYIDSQNELKSREKWMEIKILQEQFNPHFLYNTLESIRFEMILNQENASKMILSLSKLMRYSIKYHEGTVPLKEDIKYINDYLTLQKMRFGNRLNYRLDLSDSSLNVEVPKLLIQPIIENSIKYNMDVVDSLALEIYDEIHSTFCIIVIKDNGVGVSKRELQKLKKNLCEENHTRNNYGLFNVHRAIQLLYGSAYGIKIKDVQQGFSVQIYLPRGEDDA